MVDATGVDAVGSRIYTQDHLDGSGAAQYTNYNAANSSAVSIRSTDLI